MTDFFDRFFRRRLALSRVSSAFPRLVRSGRSKALLYRHRLLFIDTTDLIHATRHFPTRRSRYLIDGSDLDNRAVESARELFISDGDWDVSKVLLTDVSLVRRMISRCAGISWEACGEYEWMMDNIDAHGIQDGCRNFSDVVRRCEALDAIFSLTRERGFLLTQRELGQRLFDEKGGIGVGIDRAGTPFWLSGGAHRLGMALNIGLPYIPVSIEAIHANALRAPSNLTAIFDRSEELSALWLQKVRLPKP